MDTITQSTVDCWRANYGLDTRSPADAMRYWSETCAGMAPAGAVAALGLVLHELDRLRDDVAKTRGTLDAALDVVVDMGGEVRELEIDEARQLRKDAERYRWLRSTTNWASSKGERVDVRNNPELWDSAIDSAIAKAKVAADGDA